MIQFTHESTRYTCKPETAPKLRALLAKPKKHKPEAFKPIRRDYPKFKAGMSTADYVALFNRQFDNVQHKVQHDCPRYHMPAPMLDASIPECVEDVNPDYVPEFLDKPKKPAQTVAGLKKQIRVALDLLAAGDIDTAQCVLNESLKS